MFRGIGSGIGMHWRTKLVLWLLALGVVAMLVVFSEEPSFPKPPDTCKEKGIDPSEMKEGTCEDEGRTLDVVDIGDTLRLRTLKARLEGIHEKGPFVTFDLAIKSRAFKPVRLGENQLVLVLEHDVDQDVEAERRLGPRAFRDRHRPIAPGETAQGSVVYEVTPSEEQQVNEEGNLDIYNFGVRDEGFEIGVMRTYAKQ